MLPHDTQSKLPGDDLPEPSKADQERIDLLIDLGKKITDLFVERATQRKGKEIEWTQAQRLYNSPLQGDGSDLGETPWSDSPKNLRRPTPGSLCESIYSITPHGSPTLSPGA